MVIATKNSVIIRYVAVSSVMYQTSDYIFWIIVFSVRRRV